MTGDALLRRMYEDKHLPIADKLGSNIEYDWYESGHVYVKDDCLKQLHDRWLRLLKAPTRGTSKPRMRLNRRLRGTCRVPPFHGVAIVC